MVVHTVGGVEHGAFDLVVGADGLDSTVRSLLACATSHEAKHTGWTAWAVDEPHPRVVRRGYVVFRGTSAGDALDRGAAFQAWGPMQRFAAVPMRHNRAAWFATVACNDKDAADLIAAVVGCHTNDESSVVVDKHDAMAHDTAIDCLRKMFRGWDPRVEALLRGADPLSIVAEDARALSTSAESLLVGADT